MTTSTDLIHRAALAMTRSEVQDQRETRPLDHCTHAARSLLDAGLLIDPEELRDVVAESWSAGFEAGYDAAQDQA